MDDRRRNLAGERSSRPNCKADRFTVSGVNVLRSIPHLQVAALSVIG